MKINRIIFLLLIVIIFTLPIIILLLFSFSSSWTYPDIIPENFDLRSFNFIKTQFFNITVSILTSLLYSLCTVFLTFILTILPAKVFARYDFKLKSFLEGILLVPAILPVMVFSMGIHYIFLKIGLSDTFIGIIFILTIFSYPYMLRSLVAGYLAFKEDYNICAKNLGANYLEILFKIELPLLLPSVISGGTVVFLVSFSEYFLIFLIGGGTIPSYSGYLFPFLNSSDRSIASLLTLIFLIIPIILFIFIDRFLTIYYRNKGM